MGRGGDSSACWKMRNHLVALKIRAGLDNQEVPSASLSAPFVRGHSRAPSPGFVLIAPGMALFHPPDAVHCRRHALEIRIQKILKRLSVPVIQFQPSRFKLA